MKAHNNGWGNIYSNSHWGLEKPKEKEEEIIKEVAKPKGYFGNLLDSFLGKQKE